MLMGRGMRVRVRRGSRGSFAWDMARTIFIRDGRSGRWCSGRSSLRRLGSHCFMRRESCGLRGKKVRGGVKRAGQDAERLVPCKKLAGQRGRDAKPKIGLTEIVLEFGGRRGGDA